MIQLAEVKVYKMIIYQTFTLYINISETDLHYTISLYSLSNCYNVISLKLKAAKRPKIFVKRFLLTIQILTFLSHTAHMHVITFSTAGFI